MLVLYYFGSGTHHIGILATKQPFSYFEQKNGQFFLEPIFFESAKRAALFDGESVSASGAPIR